MRLPLIFVFLTLLPISAYAEPYKAPHVEVELVTETEGIPSNGNFWAGVHFRLDNHWHIYWKNPGDSGLQPMLRWNLPSGFSVSEIQWPYPSRLQVGPLVNYGYENEVLLPVEMSAPPLTQGQSVSLRLHLEWLVCEEECIPGEANLSLDTHAENLKNGAVSSWAPLFAATREMVPVEGSTMVRSVLSIGPSLEIHISIPDEGFSQDINPTFFPDRKGMIENSSQQSIKAVPEKGELVLSLKRSPVATSLSSLSGILVSDVGWGSGGSRSAVSFTAPVTTEAMPMSGQTASFAERGFLVTILFAFLGGLILNLMPCVFPILSIKILGFVEQAGESKGLIRLHGVVFGVGVLVSFWILAGMLLIFRAIGEEVGWGFQFQSPVFVLSVLFLIFILSLNLLGVFEIGTSLQRHAGKIDSRDGLWGSFGTGVLTTILSTPCSAPFMGTAIPIALSLPTFLALLIFTALAAGVTAPYLLFSFYPALLSHLPRPGEWMCTFKKLMAFPLLGTCIWLLWVLGEQGGVSLLIRSLVGLLVASIGLWILGCSCGPSCVKRERRSAQALCILFIIGGFLYGMPSDIGPQRAISDTEYSDYYGQRWERFSPDRLKELLMQHKAVFLDFTAAWCVTCQVNELVAFGSKEVRDKIEEKGVVLLRGDWTRKDPVITEALKSFGRSAVPLNVIYSSDPSVPPHILPSVLTPGIILEALR